MILDCHQVEGKYGFNNVRKHDTMLAASAKGGMNSQIFSKWAEKIYDLYPSARDADNHRVCMKADSGPGRHTNDFLIQSRSRGFLFYPGLCHVTEEVQEMDQEYAKTKTAMENNRDELYKARHNANPSKLTPIDESDVPVLLFGGKVPIEDGSIVELENAFEKSFNKESIKRSLEKCGYCPATRAGLRSTKLRRGVRSDDQDSKLQSNKKRFEEMIKEIEVENHKTVKILIEKGYTTATVFQRWLKKESIITSQLRASVKTTTICDLSDKNLKKLLEVKTAGQWFSFTGGGGPLNCTAMIQARQMQENAKQIKLLQKEQTKYGSLLALQKKCTQIQQKNLRTGLVMI